MADAGWTLEPAQTQSGGWTLEQASPSSQEQPGMVSKALRWLTTPFKNMEPIAEQLHAEANANPGPLALKKDSGDARTAFQALLSGAPGFTAGTESDEAKDRMDRFRKEHKIASILLPLAGGLGKPGALPAVAGEAAAEAGPLSRALTGASRSAGRRTLYGGAETLSTKYPVTDASIDAAHEAGAFKPFGTTEHAANVLSDALDEAGSVKGDVVKAMESAGIKGPDSENMAQLLRHRAAYLRKNTAGTTLPELYESIASDIEAAGNGGRLGVRQAENIKTSLQKQAKYGRPEETLQNIERRKIASTMRQGVEDAAFADAATIGTPQLEKIRSDIDSIRGWPAQTGPHPGIGPNADVVSPAARAVQDSRAAALTAAAQDAAAQLIPAKNAYALLAPAAKAAEKGLSQSAKRNAFSLRDTIMAAPVLAAEGPVSAAKVALATKLMRRYGPSTVAWGARKAAGVSGRMSEVVDALVARGVPQNEAEAMAQSMGAEPAPGDTLRKGMTRSAYPPENTE